MLYLVQHGEATTKDQDPDRPLTERGELAIRNLGQFLEQAGVRVDTVLESGKLRARQTAEFLSEYLTPGLAPEEMAGLGATEPVGPVIDKVRELDRHLMLVSHMPLVGAVTGAMVAGAEDRPPVAFRPGTAVALAWAEEQGWQVAWMIPPELLR